MYRSRVIEIGRRVKIGEHGVSVFAVVEIEDEDHVLIESVLEDSPGRYPFSMPVRALRIIE